jgi:WD40 repeat protein
VAGFGFVRQDHLWVFRVTPGLPDRKPAIYARDGSSWSKRHTLKLESNPEALHFLPDSQHLVFSRREDFRLNYLSLSQPGFPIQSFNLNERQDEHVSFTIMHIARHPTEPLLSLQTDATQSQIFLVPFLSHERLATLFTSASQSEYSTPRHAWFPDGSAIAVASDDGLIWVVEPSTGRTIQCVRAHGLSDVELARTSTKEEIRARIQQDKGSSLIKDICVFEGPDGPTIGTCSYDRTIRLTQCRRRG